MNPANDKWRTLDALPTPREALAAAELFVIRHVYEELVRQKNAAGPEPAGSR
jgi:hypothetical protein